MDNDDDENLRPRVSLQVTLYMDGNGLPVSEARQAIQWPYELGYL